MNKALSILYSRKNAGIKLGLENISKFLFYLDNPERRYKIVHIAGSNGKGSTSSFIASIFQESGFKTGLYTSPHFVKFNERIRINGVMIEDDYVENFLIKHENYINKELPSFFEISTAMAYQYFADNFIDFAVIETGLGGRLDATNTSFPIASVITNISLEHTVTLGDTIDKIAFEKGGIIKTGVPVFIGITDNKAYKVFEKISNEKKSQIFFLQNYLSHNKISYLETTINLIDIPLAGEHQILNAGLASLTTAYLGLNQSFIEKGLKNVLINTGIKARFEKVNSLPDLFFDSAHNIAGIEVFIKEFIKFKKRYNKNILVFSSLKDKDYHSAISILDNLFDEIVFVQITNNERAEDVNILYSYSNNKNKRINTPEKEIKNFLKSGNENNAMFVIGSMYLIGFIKEKLDI